MNAFTILINGKNRASAAFESAEQGMSRLNKRAAQLKQLFVSGVVVGMLKKISDAIMSTTTRGDELAAAGDKAKSAWRDVGSVIADGMAGAVLWFQKVSAASAGTAKDIVDDMRRGAGYLTGRIAGMTPEEASRNAAEDVDLANQEAQQRRWAQDKGVQGLEKKQAEQREKTMSATERLADATAKLAQEEAKLAGLGQYDLDRVPVLNSILELQGKIAAAMKDQVAEAAKLREAELGIQQEMVEGERMRLAGNQAALEGAREGIRKGFSQRQAERREQRAEERAAREAANREEVAMKQAARDPQRRYRQQLRQQLERAGMGIGEAGALLNQGADANAPRTGARGISDRYRRLLGASEAVADQQKVVNAAELAAAKAMTDFERQQADQRKAHPELVPLGQIKTELENLNKNLVGG